MYNVCACARSMVGVSTGGMHRCRFCGGGSLASLRCSRVVGPSALRAWPRCRCPPHGALVSSIANGSRHFLLTTFSDGCLGSNNDEGRSEVR